MNRGSPDFDLRIIGIFKTAFPACCGAEAKCGSAVCQCLGSLPPSFGQLLSD